MFEGLETRAYLSVSVNNQGWTVVTPSSDTRTIYVSTSGSDSNSGLSPTAPVASLAVARTLVRNNAPDQILFRRGDTFFGTPISGWDLSGRSAQEPFVLGAYTDPATPSIQRPKFSTGIANGFQSTSAANSHVYIMGIAFEAHLRNFRSPPANNTFTTNARTDAQGGTNGIRITGAFSDLLVEDCSFQYYETNMTIQSTTVNGVYRPVSDVKLRRNFIADAYAVNVDSNGIVFQEPAVGVYAEGVSGLTMDGNTLAHNGWVEDNALGALANVYSHNAYINSSVDNFVFINNIVTDASSHGLQARGGGIIKDNLFLRNPVAMSFGYMNGSGNLKAGGVYGEISGNVVVGTSRIVDSPRGYGLEIGNLRSTANGGGTIVRNNVFANDAVDGSQYAIKLDVSSVDSTGSPPDVGINDLRVEGNVVYSWALGMSVHPWYNNVSSSIYRPLNNLVVKGNDFQRIFAGNAAMLDHFNRFMPALETWSDNRYDGSAADAGSSRWFRVGGGVNQITFAQWQAAYEPTRCAPPGCSLIRAVRRRRTTPRSAGRRRWPPSWPRWAGNPGLLAPQVHRRQGERIHPRRLCRWPGRHRRPHRLGRRRQHHGGRLDAAHVFSHLL